MMRPRTNSESMLLTLAGDAFSSAPKQSIFRKPEIYGILHLEKYGFDDLHQAFGSIRWELLS